MVHSWLNEQHEDFKQDNKNMLLLEELAKISKTHMAFNCIIWFYAVCLTLKRAVSSVDPSSYTNIT